MTAPFAITFRRMLDDGGAEAVDDGGRTHRITPAASGTSIFLTLRVGQRLAATSVSNGDITTIALP